jgi:hypothetical protein
MKRIMFLLFSLFALSGCTRCYYGPTQHNVPMFKEKNEARLSGTYSTINEIPGGEVQAAYAPTKGLGLIGNAAFFGKWEEGKAQLYELGAGYYKAVPTKRAGAPGNIVVEVYGVAGWGRVTNDACSGYVRVDMVKSYVQPSFGFANEKAEAFLSAKIGVVHLYNIKETLGPYPCYGDQEEYYPYTNGDAEDDLHIMQLDQTGFLVEPAVTMRFGLKYVKWHIQLGGSFLTSHLDDVSAPFNFNTGLLFSFAPRFLKKNRKIEGMQY